MARMIGIIYFSMAFEQHYFFLKLVAGKQLAHMMVTKLWIKMILI